MLSTSPIASLSSAPTGKLPSTLSASKERPTGSVEKARELKQAFGQFVGETFFGQMLSSMRKTVGEPAYFHGGMAERQFQARLDQQIAQDMAASGGGFADDLFRSEFPREAALLDAEESRPAADSLDQLASLRRR